MKNLTISKISLQVEQLNNDDICAFKFPGVAVDIVM